jgi:hypothetical protein
MCHVQPFAAHLGALLKMPNAGLMGLLAEEECWLGNQMQICGGTAAVSAAMFCSIKSCKL